MNDFTSASGKQIRGETRWKIQGVNHKERSEHIDLTLRPGGRIEEDVLLCPSVAVLSVFNAVKPENQLTGSVICMAVPRPMRETIRICP